MPSSELQSKLAELLELLDETPSQHTVEKCNNLIGEIQLICLRTTSENELAYHCSVVFHKETGILLFLKKTITIDQYVSSKERILEFVYNFMIRADKKIVTYALDIKDVCLSLFTRDKMAKIKNRTFPILNKLLELTANTPVAKELGVSKLIDKYFSQLMQPSKLAATVKHGIYHLLGVFAQYYPELMTKYSDRLLNVYMKALKDQMLSKTKQAELPVVAGCLLGLTHLLVNFTQSVEEEAPHAWDIFRFTRMAIDPKVGYTRFDVPKAGLWLLAKHAPQFNKYLLDDHEEMYDKLFSWCQHHNRDMKSAGYASLEAFLKQVASMLVEEGNKDKRNKTTIFKAFIRKFRSIIDNRESGTREICIAIKGYGLFAAPCKLFLSEDDVKFMFNEMIQRSEQLYFSQNELVDEKIPHLPSFLEALACIVRELDEVSDTFLSSLETMTVILMENFPRFGKALHYTCYKSITAVLVALSPKGATLRNFVSRIVYQGLIRTCSHPVVLEGEMYDVSGDETSDELLIDARKVSYKDYLDLWNHLLDSSQLRITDIGLSPQDCKVLHNIVYDELIAAIIRILGKLDLSSNKDGQLGNELSADPEPGTSDGRSSPVTDLSSDPSSGLTPSKPKDFQIFINLVEFCRDFLPKRCPYYFERWVYTFGHEVIVHSTRLPLVSGFYKLLSVCMTISQNIGYFQGINENAKVAVPRHIEEKASTKDMCTLADKVAAFHLFKKFTKEVLIRLKQYKDDLLASCLFLVLALPHEIIASDVAAIVPALQTTFRIGLGYLPLAHAGLDALETWAFCLQHNALQPYYKDILPCLDGYLKTVSDTNAENASSQTVSLTMTRTGKRRNKIPIRLLKPATQDGSDESPLTIVKLKIVHLLGLLGGSTNGYLLESSKEEIAKKAVAWDTENHLQFPVPFMDIKPVICFDPFLPRVVELATTSSDRQTKVAACELLHSLVLYMVGRGAQQPDSTQVKAPMEKLYKKVLPALLQLSCDVEQVARQLFEPLLSQLIHWFTCNKKFESPETIAMLDAILDGICHPTDTALRDFSAKCVKEFLYWSIKQTSKKTMEKSPINTKSLLKRLYSLALHPNVFKRLGSALAFNSIYTVYREEDSLVDQFVLEILVIYINSLAMAHCDDKSLGTQEQCVHVVDHLERIIRVKANMLNRTSKTRRVPRDFNRDDCPTLSHVVTWLLLQCGRLQTECRHQCMILVCKLIPLLPGNNSASTWMHRTMAEKGRGPDYFITRFEGGGGKGGHKTGISKHPTLNTVDKTFSVKVASNWFDLFLAALDCYTWVFGEKLLEPIELFAGKANKPTNVFKSVDFFLSKLALEDVYAAAKCITSSSAGLIFTPREIDDYNKYKCTAIVRLLDFISVLLAVHTKDLSKSIPLSFWSTNLFEVIVSCVLDPSSVGFDMADIEVISNLPKTTGQLLMFMTQKAPGNVSSEMKKCLQEKLKPKSHMHLMNITPSILKGDDKGINYVKLTHMVSGYEQLHKANLLLPALQKTGSLGLHGWFSQLVELSKMSNHSPSPPIAKYVLPENMAAQCYYSLNTGMASGDKFSQQLLTAVFESISTKQSNSLIVSHLSPTAHELAVRLLDLAFLLASQSKELVSCLMNKTPVKTGRVDSSAGYYGLSFYSHFKVPINTQLAQHGQEVVPLLLRHVAADSTIVSTILNGLLDHITNNRELRKKKGLTVHAAILSNWSSLKSWWSEGATHDQRSSTLILLKKLLQIDSKFASDPTHAAFKPVFDMYLNMVTDSNTSLAFKSRVLEILYFFTRIPEQELSLLQGRLNRLIADNFPLKSSEFVVGSPKYNDYVAAFGKILSALVISGSLMLLELLISIMCREPKHVCEDQIQASLITFIKHLPADKQKPAVDVAFDVFHKENVYPNDIRRAALERVGLPLLRLVDIPTLSTFFISHVNQIMNTIEAKQIKVPESSFETQLVSKIGCFELMEVLYSRMTKEELNTPQSKVNKIYCRDSVKSGKEMTMALTKIAHAAKGEDIRGESVLVELRRQYHCAAYNALVAIVSCTQNDIKFYNGFLFAENHAKGQFFLDNLVDADKVYHFEIEMESPMERKKKFVAIRKEVRDASEEDDLQDSAVGLYGTGGVRYLSSQYLADSSLSEEISQFDMNTAAFTGTLDKDKTAASGNTSQGPRSASPLPPSAFVKGDYLEMEMDELNLHECMSNMTALLKHMKRNKVTPEVAKGTVPHELPGYMSYLQKKLSGPSTNPNVKLFIIKLIINAEEVFRPYAKFWLAPLMEWILGGQTGGDGIHYMIGDIVVLMLTWSAIAKPEAGDRILASRLVEYLMHHTHHSNRQVLRNNLEMVKTVVELWRDCIEVPSRVIFEAFSGKDPKGKENATGIQLLGVILSNQLPPYRDTCGIDKDRFYTTLSANLSFKYKDVYAASAEVVGMVMKYMAEKEKVTDGTFHDNVFREISSSQSSRPEVFITCIYKVQLYYKPFTDRFINKLLFMLPQIHGQPKTYALEVVLGRVDSIDKIFLEMKNKRILEMLRHRDETIQLVSLKIVNAMLKRLNEEELLYLMPTVVSFSKNLSPACRETMYDILTWIYDNYKDEESSTAAEVLSMTKEILLQGLSDEESYLRLRVSNFWSHETRLPVGTLDRMVSMLECMYSPDAENQFLSYATSLLLEMTSKSPDYKREIFEHALSECKFEDYQIDHSWKRRHAAISTPMFVETQSTQIGSDSQSFIETIGNQVRATQDVQFSATQEVDGKKTAYNWLTGSQDTFSEFSSSTGTETSQSSLLFTIGTTKKKAITRKPVGSGFGKDKMGAGKDQTDSTEDTSQTDREIMRLKRRFLKDQEASRAFFARREIRLKKMREEAQKEQKLRRHNMVTLYRSYRQGDLPDIQIKHMYLIAPLQALAQRDTAIARQLFSSLFCGVFAQIAEEKTEREREEIIKNINEHLNSMLSNSTQYFSPFIGCIEDIAYHNCKELMLDAQGISTASLISQQQPLGLLLLEEYLVQKSGEEERSRKRPRGSASPLSQEISTWIELSRLYKDLDNFDVLRGIFSGKVGTQPVTREALEAEASANYQKAANLYDEALGCTDWPDGRPEQVEEDLWDDCRLQCYEQLTDWQKLEQASTVNIDDNDPPDLDKIWDDTYYQEHYLPYVIKSKLKLLMEDDDTDGQSLLTFIDKSMQHKERKALIENRYSEALAMLYLLQDDYDRARYYTANCIQSFLQDWSGTDTLMGTIRSSKLQCVQKLSEMQEFLTFITNERNFDEHKPVSDLISKWTKRLPDVKRDSTNTWDDVITNRVFYLRKLFQKSGDAMEGDDGQAMVNAISKDKLLMELKLVDSVSQQNNFGVAEKYLKRNCADARDDDAWRLIWTHSYARLHQKKCLTLPPSKRVINLLTTLDQLGMFTEGCEPSYRKQHEILSGRSCHLVAQTIQEAGDDIFDVIHLKCRKSLRSLIGSIGDSLSLDEIVNGLQNKAHEYFKKGVKLASDEEDAIDMDREGVIDAYVSMATFCDKMLKQQEQNEDGAVSRSSKSPSFPRSVVFHLLKALKLNSVEAIQRFPRLLQIVETYTDTMDTFVELTSETPCWMFLGWIGQMLALLDKVESISVQGILLEIANNYPQALVYPFKVSSENFSFENTVTGKRNKEKVSQLAAILDNVPLVMHFICALEQLTNPEHICKDFTDDVLVPALRARNPTAVKKAVEGLYTRVFDSKRQSSQDSFFSEDSDAVTQSLPFGPFQKKFASDFVKPFQKRFGERGCKILSMQHQTFQKEFMNFRNEVDQLMRKKKMSAPGNLREYSPWLSDFQPINYEKELEIPGQYKGRSKPLLEYHVKIAGFDEKVKVMSSLRKPKRLTIRGNDEKEHNFLVKGGEDLRLDQRIEQLFGIMNDILALDAACSQRSLKLVTYEVIPMTPRIGIIEWVDHCLPLKVFLSEAMTKNERSHYANTRLDHHTWVDKMVKHVGDRTSHCVRYGELYKVASRTEILKKFQDLHTQVPWDALRRAFQRLSSSPEAFLTLRGHFATSHALLCICQYILGIGDRHLSNFMISLDTGAMVGIDFGHAFGSAVELLPVPELMPIRLTRQIVNLMTPMKEDGLILSTMVHGLRALRNNPDLLLNTMDVFVKEPHLDWQKRAKSDASKYGDAAEDANEMIERYAKDRINNARRKLQGANPCHITRDELKMNVNTYIKKHYCTGYIDVCMGDKKYSMRTREPATGLSVEKQVACLVDQAIDPNILGRAYEGWEAWV